MNENHPYWWLHEEPEKWWKMVKLGEMEIPHYTGTATIPTDPEQWNKLQEMFEKRLNRKTENKKKPTKRKREPAYRFLKQKDIDKLMDKYFDAKK